MELAGSGGKRRGSAGKVAVEERSVDREGEQG
jgi:hypothetical protein